MKDKTIYSVIIISGFRNWSIEVLMSADTGRVTISRFSSDTEEQKQILQETVIFLCYKLNGLLLMIFLLAHLKQVAVFPGIKIERYCSYDG